MSTSTTCLWYRMSLRAVTASMFGARMRVGPKTMARFSAFIRLNFSFSATLQFEIEATSLNKQMNLQSNSYLHNRSKRPGWNHFPRGWWQRSPLQVRHEVLQGFTVWWRQQSQRFSESFELLLRICEFWMDTDRIAAVRTQCDDATGNISNEPFHSNKFQPETVHFVLIHVTYSQPRWTSGKRRMRWWERANPSGRVWARP